MIQKDALIPIKTLPDMQNFAAEIETVKESLFEEKRRDQIFQSISAKNADIIREILKKEHIDCKNNKQAQDALNELIAKIKSLKIVKLYLAFSPSQNLTDDIFNWVSDKLGKGIILDIEEEPTILGGAIVEYNGKHIDYSLKKQIEEAYEDF